VVYFTYIAHCEAVSVLEEKKTPLFDKHIALGGKMVPFAGYLLPVQYSGVIAEHTVVRSAAGLFDVSHMGEFMLEGPGALRSLQLILTNSFDNLKDFRARYSLMCGEDGGVIDDLLVFRFNENKYMLVVNASNREKDAAWISSHIAKDTAFKDISDKTALIALQGPRSEYILGKLADIAEIPKKYYSFTPGLEVAGVKCLVSRTGYTGEDGFELYSPASDSVALWDALLIAGKDSGLVPVGLGARDTLRLEAGMPLYGHEMDESVSPFEAALGFAVKMDKPDFIGKNALINRGEPQIVRAGLKMTSRGIAREGCRIFAGGFNAGRVTSGTHLPSLGFACAMALVDKDYAATGTQLSVEVRGRTIEAEVVPLPFYRRERLK